jgi:hypothetical protein
MVGLGDVLSVHARAVRAGLASALTVVLGAILMSGPEGIAFSRCLFRELTGMSCLTCGLTRSLQAAFHGHLEASFTFHLLGPFVLAGTLVLALVWAAETFTGRRFSSFQSARRLRHVFPWMVSIWVVYGVARVIFELH